MSANAHELFRGFSFIAPQLVEEMSIKPVLMNTNIDNSISLDTFDCEGKSTTGWVRSLKEFQFCEEIGRGAFSVCKRCVHKETGKSYAVKVSFFITNQQKNLIISKIRCFYYICKYFNSILDYL